MTVKNIRYLSADEEKNSDDTELFKWYTNDLEVLAYFVAENKNIKSVDPYIKAHFLNNCKHWSSLRVINGDVILTGIGHGRINPRTVEFEKSDGSCQKIPVCDLEF